MEVNYVNALKVEQIIARQFFKIERTGWPVDLHRMEEVHDNLIANMTALEDHLIPTIPMIPKPKGTEVKKPFKKGGDVSAIVIKHMEEFSDQVQGPFSKIEWFPINLKSDRQVKKYLLSIGWKPIEWNINKKTRTVTSPKLTEESFYSLKSDIGQQLSLYLKLASRESLVRGLKERVWFDDKGQPRISQIISGMTPTFRCTHKGIVNIPGGDAIFGLAVRSIFVAPEGYKMLGVDAKSCQLRMLCHYMQDPIYTEAVLHGTKEAKSTIHYVNMGLTGGMITKITQAKRFIYAFLFGGGNPMLGSILSGDKHDGKRLRDEFMTRLPTLKVLLDNLEDTWKKRGYLIGLDGRKIFVRAKHMLLVYLLQGAEGILMRWSLALLCTWGFFEKFDIHMVGFIHDEFQFYVKDDQADLAAEWVLRAIESASIHLELTVPAEGDASTGYTWKDTH